MSTLECGLDCLESSLSSLGHADLHLSVEGVRYAGGGGELEADVGKDQLLVAELDRYES